jgi:N-acetylglucosaminyl-diphospho-decaprenol L-rhamnosyltransferase
MSRPSEAQPTVSVITVTYQSGEVIDACLRSTHEHAGVSFESIVVDNASTDDTRRRVAEGFPSVRLLPLAENRWYTAAANAGAALASGRYLLFLNPDAELTPNALPNLVSYLEIKPAVAAAGPRLLFPDGSPQASGFTYPTLLMTWLEFFPHPGRLLETRLNGRLASTDGAPISIDHPLGACMLIRREAWEDVGSFDEGFVYYCEEVDWCMRAKQRGWTIVQVPGAVVVHQGGVSTAWVPGRSLEHLYASRERLHRKHRGPLFRAGARVITRLGLGQERRRLRRQARSPQVSEDVTDRVAAIDRVLSRPRA